MKPIFILSFFLIQLAHATTESEVAALFSEAKTNKTSYQARNISPAVFVVEQLIEQLKAEINVQQAGQRVATLRRLIGEGAGVGGLRTRKTHGANYKVHPQERTILVNALTYIETAAALVDGHYSFHFCQREQTQPYGASKTIPGTYRRESAQTFQAIATDGRLTLEEQKHLTVVYALARSTQLRIENESTPIEELPVYIGRTINSRHLPLFMRDTYKTDFISSLPFADLLKSQLDPWALIKFNAPGLKLVLSRKREKEADSRLSFETQELNVVIEEYVQNLGRSICREKGIRTVKEKMQVYAIPPNHGCEWYAKHSIYGYEQPWDIIDLIIDNIEDDTNNPLLVDFVNGCLVNFSIALPDDMARLKNQIKDLLLKAASTEERQEIESLFSSEQPDAHEKWLNSKYAKWCINAKLIKEVLNYYRT